MLVFTLLCWLLSFPPFWTLCFLISKEEQESWCIHNVFASTEQRQCAATKRLCVLSKTSFTELLHIHACAKRHFHNKRVSLRALCVVLLRAAWHSVCHLVSLRRRRGTHTMAAWHRRGGLLHENKRKYKTEIRRAKELSCRPPCSHELPRRSQSGRFHLMLLPL